MHKLKEFIAGITPLDRLIMVVIAILAGIALVFGWIMMEMVSY